MLYQDVSCAFLCQNNISLQSWYCNGKAEIYPTQVKAQLAAKVSSDKSSSSATALYDLVYVRGVIDDCHASRCAVCLLCCTVLQDSEVFANKLKSHTPVTAN